jgi:hypothetical protein
VLYAIAIDLLGHCAYLVLSTVCLRDMLSSSLTVRTKISDKTLHLTLHDLQGMRLPFFSDFFSKGKSRALLTESVKFGLPCLPVLTSLLARYSEHIVAHVRVKLREFCIGAKCEYSYI